jgi:Periplasmic copper-binding protein (NosD)
MKNSVLLAIVSTICLAFWAMPAHAQATRTWISGTGDDTNPCSRTAPCKTFPGAISKTATGGEINCLDPGGFGAVTITKSITLNCEETLGSILVSGTPGITVNAAGGFVTIKGIEIEGLTGNGGGATSTNGINVVAAAEVHIHKFQIRDFGQNGISLAPTSGSPKVFIADGYISVCGSTSPAVSNAGILIRPTGGATMNVSVNHVQVESCSNGIFMDGSGGGGVSNLAVRDSVFAGGAFNGIAVSSSSPAFSATVTNSMMNSNAGVGAAAAGGSAKLALGGNTIANNVTGVSNSGGTLQSFKNNQFFGNLSDGTPITAVPGNSGTLQ